MVKFKSVSDDELSSSDESNAGLVRWNRKPSADDNKDASSLNSFSLSGDSDENSSSSSTSFISSRSRSISESSRSSSSDHTTKRTKKLDKNKQELKTNLKKKLQSSDESVVFANDGSIDEETILKKNNSDTNFKHSDEKTKIVQKSRAKSQDTNNKGQKLTENFAKSKFKRQFIYIQMEYCGGKTLKDLIEKGLYKNQEKVWFLLREILQGLNHIHEQGMIHRDLKPGNVLIDALGHAKIGDFGLATSKLIMQNDNKKSLDISILGDNSASLIGNNVGHSADSKQLDSVSMSGAVGTALYVAPELITPSNKNRFIYTQVKLSFKI